MLLQLDELDATSCKLAAAGRMSSPAVQKTVKPKPSIFLFSNEKTNSMHQNPVLESLVYQPEENIYRSATDYAGEKGILDTVIVIK